MSRAPFVSLLLAAIFPAFAAPAAPASLQDPAGLVLVRDGVARGGARVAPGRSSGNAATAGAAVSCGAFSLAEHGAPAPGGGSLAPSAFADVATVADGGAIAFVSRVDGDPQNQGVFRSDGDGIHSLVRGCGGDGGTGVGGAGCGDPTPVGGTFAGFFHGTFFAPPINAAGDVLFLADVAGGSSPRGLFLYREATGAVEKVAAVGDVLPGGITVDAVGPGSLNDAGRVVFLVRAPAGAVAILSWEAGVTSEFAVPGDPAPGGGSFSLLASEELGFSDGTTMPVGPVPGLDDAGRVSFRAQVVGGPGGFGLFVADGDTITPYVRTGDPTPAGGTFTQFQGAPIADSGEIAFFADFVVGGDFTSGWFVGSPDTGVRKAMVFGDAVGDATVVGMAFSRNPMTPLDELGNLVLWARLELPDRSLEDRLLVATSGGELVTLAAAGDPAPSGGTLSNFQSWPSLDSSGLATLSASLSGAPGGVISAHALSQLCPPAPVAVVPSSGSFEGGDVVTIDGSGFAAFGGGDQLEVSFGGVPATGVTVLSDLQVQATVPAAEPGPADVAVAHPFGTAVLAGSFLYTPAVLVAPASLPLGGTATIENHGPPGALFQTWFSTETTSIPVPPHGTLLIGPSPFLPILPATVYPPGGVASADVPVPANPALSGTPLHLQSLATLSVAPLELRLTNAASATIR